MSKRSVQKRKKGVVLRKPTQAQGDTREVVAAPPGDIYQSVVRKFGFDPIRESEERRRLV